MNVKNKFKPGQLITTDFGTYMHYSIVSDAWCDQGELMLISATAKTNTVTEEPYDDLVRGRSTQLASSQSSRPVDEILSKARSQIGKWEYRLINGNCEDFVYWRLG